MPAEGTASAHCSTTAPQKKDGDVRLERRALRSGSGRISRVSMGTTAGAGNRGGTSREGCSSFQLRMDISY